MIQLLAARAEIPYLVLCPCVYCHILSKKEHNLEWKAYTRVDTVVPTHPKPISKYEHHLVQFVTVS